MGWIQLVIVIIQIIYELIKMFRGRDPQKLARVHELWVEFRAARRAGDKAKMKAILDELIELRG